METIAGLRGGGEGNANEPTVIMGRGGGGMSEEKMLALTDNTLLRLGIAISGAMAQATTLPAEEGMFIRGQIIALWNSVSEAVR